MATNGDRAYEQVFSHPGKVTKLSLPHKAVVEFFNHGGKKCQALLFSNRMYKKSGEQHINGELIVRVVETNQEILFDGHVLHSVGPDGCDWIITRAWVPGSNVTFTGTGTVIEVGTGQGVILMDNIDNEDEGKIFFLASKVFYFGSRLKKPLPEMMSVGDRLQFEAVLMDATEKPNNPMQKGCKYFGKVLWKGTKPVISSKNDTNGIGEQRPRSSSTDSASSQRSNGTLPENSRPKPSPLKRPFVPGEELAPGKHLMADFWHDHWVSTMKSDYSEDETLAGSATVLEYLDHGCGLLLHHAKEEGQFTFYETVFFHRNVVFVAGENFATKDLKAWIPLNCNAEFEAVRAPEEMPCKWIATKVSVVFAED